MTIYFVLAGILLCVILSGMFSASEMAFSSCNELRLENDAEDGSKKAKRALKVRERFDDALGAILIGNNLVNIAASSLGSVATILLFESDDKAWIATLVITLLVIVFGETIPKISAKKNANRYACGYSGFIRVLMIVLKPLIWLTVSLIHLLTGRMKEEEAEDPDEDLEELSSIVETCGDEGVLDPDQQELVQAAIDFSDISAFEVMTARVDMQALNIEDSLEEILAFVDQTPYSRLPVYEGSIDRIIGTLHLNHLLKALTETDAPDLRALLFPPCYVYKTTKLPEVLSILKKAKQHLAIVADEYGGTLGVISMEDVLEQIVGEIWDETDTVEEDVKAAEGGALELDGDLSVYDFLELAGIPEDGFECDSDTVGGLFTETFGTFPREGDVTEIDGVRLTVLAMDGLRVEKLRLEKPEKTEE